MSLLLIDTETTGLNTKEDRILEIGAMLVTDSFEPISSWSSLVWDIDYPAVTPEVTKITGITGHESSRITPKEALDKLKSMITPEMTEVVAHNASFDEAIVTNEIKRQNRDLEGPLHYLVSKPWLCSMEDIEGNYEFKHWRLAHLALEYYVAVDPNELHRVLGDIELMRRMLIASKTTPKAMRDFKDEPWIYVQSIVSKPWEDGGLSTTAAKKLGFSYERARGDNSGREFSKTWIKRIKQKHLQKERDQAPFQLVIVT